jgi:hypothetical protein
MRLRLVVHMVQLQILLFRARPALVGNLAIGRIDNDTLAAEECECRRVLLHAIWRSWHLRYPISFEVGFSVWRPLNGPGFVWSALAGAENVLAESAWKEYCERKQRRQE